MAIEKNSFNFVIGARLDSEFYREESMSSEENGIQKLADAESDDDNGDEYEDYDSAAGSDEFDLLELGETGEEFCQIGDQTCCIPFELYDLEGLGDILSMDVWNNVLTDDERFGLAKYLPDMDHETFMRTMKELFTCCNFHFQVPVNKLFNMLKGGLCEPRVALYRQGLGFFQKRHHYHVVRKHQNTMVNNLVNMKETWMKYREYGIEEKLQVLNIMKSENLEEEETSSSDWEDYGNGFQRIKKQKGYEKQKWVRYPGFRSRPTFDFLPRGKQLALEPANHRKDNSKGSLKVSKISTTMNHLGKKFKYPDNNQEIPGEDPMIYRKFRGAKLSKRDSRLDMNNGVEPIISQRKPGLVHLPYKQVDWKLNNKNGLKMVSKGEETESDSSKQFSGSDDDDPLIRSKWLYPSSGVDFRKAKFRMKDKRSIRALDGFPEASGKNDEEEIYSVSAKRKVKTSCSGRLNNSNVRGLEDAYRLGPRKLNTGGHMEELYNVVGEQCETFQVPKTYSVEKNHFHLITPDSFRLITPETPVTETTMEDACLENKSQKKPFTLITPTVHTGFSFSIIHLLSAVRMAMITLLPEDSVNLGKHHHMNDDSQTNASYLTVQEIVNRVKSNPGDPCILETQEPLHDLVRGVLKIFSSRSSPLGAKGWKPLAVYDRNIKSWSWVGPISRSSSDHEAVEVEEVTSPDSWGLSYRTLVKLVDSFANWLKSGQETLQQIGSLPPPPLNLMQVNLDEKERFRDLKAQRSLNTITQSPDEIKDYFHKEEALRYSIPNRAFAYTAIDGKKSTVAPSKKGAGKPTSKARDHFMLKRDRPPHVTILCLVRDATARLPGSIGTRADVCTLIRDSQYVVEDVSDAQVNQVVSGALDRLHYERDPCVQFDGERKLWVYLHREREEEDFEDDATSSTKKWKRQKKESIESSDLDAVTCGTSEQTGLDFSSDLNLDPSGVDNVGKKDALGS